MHQPTARAILGKFYEPRQARFRVNPTPERSSAGRQCSKHGSVARNRV
ncbi:hypothetical protein DFR74_103416 [Nocardia puris]|uniref:Uncharacterized protein n=1 Tax=Nocardia puris TaxID=208602 RepID=A0A366DRP4_9NOCA|nr:hypothetical protein DFR74_103416 [Nocardia puris]